MTHIYCDICKREVEDPVPNRTFFTLGHIEFCEPCRDDIEAVIKYKVREKKPFDIAWFDDLRMKLIEQATQKGKVDVKRNR